MGRLIRYLVSVTWLVATPVAHAGLVGHWTFDEGTGLTAFDSAKGRDGALSGSVGYVAGLVGYALDFSGGQVTISPTLLQEIQDSPNKDVSVSLWIHPDSFGFFKTVFDTGPRELSLWINAPGDGYLAIGQIVEGYNSYAPEWTLGEWQHLVVTWSNTANLFKVYRNGVLNSTSVIGPATPSFGAAWVIGGNPSGGGTAWDGRIDDVQVYDTVLSQQEIEFLRDNPGSAIRGGHWVSAGTGAGERFMHSATLLADGRVLIAGGYTSAVTPQSGAVLFDPATSSFTAAPSMAFARAEHTATRLLDGRVLVAGGDGSATTAEIYDPVANSWTSVASMETGRREFTATLLADGRVLVVGGVSVGTARVYNPGTNTWSSAGTLSGVRFLHAAALLPDGRVLMAGGTDGAGATLATTEIYDPATNAWTVAQSMSAGRYIGTLSVLPDGRVLAVGGANGTSAETTAEIFDPETNMWFPATSMDTGRYMHAATLLPGEDMLVTGGFDGSASLGEVEIYDLATDSWTPTRPMAVARRLHTATLLLDGRVLVVGGRTASGATAESELFSPKAEQVIAFDPLPDRTFGDSPFAVSASASSGVTVSFASAGNCSVAGDMVTITGAGSCTITASAPGDLDYSAGSLARTFAIAKAAATLTLGGLAQTYDGTPRVVTVTTSPPALGTVTLTYNGASTPPTGGGSYAIVASLSNPDYQAPDATGTLVVAPAGQTIAFDPLPARTYGDPPFAVSALASSGLPVSFTAAGQCTVVGATVTLTGAGSCTMTASQAGNENYLPASSVERTFAILKAPTTTTVESSADRSLVGQGVAFTATVTSTAGGIPTGTVTFRDGNVPMGDVPLNAAGQARFMTAALTAGAHNVRATYNGDTNFAGSSGTVQQTVDKFATTTELTSSQNPSLVNQAVEFTAKVSPPAGLNLIPTGTVTFKGGSIKQSVTVSAGEAKFTTTLKKGVKIAAEYGGDPTFAASTSPLLPQDVQ